MILVLVIRVVGFLWFFYVSLFYYIEEFDNIEKEFYLGLLVLFYSVREFKLLFVEVEVNFLFLYNCII